MSRRTAREMGLLRAAIVEMAEVNQPCTVRQIYYLGIGRYWEKDVGGKRNAYKMVVRLVGEMREDGDLPWGWIADNTRWVRRATMFKSKEQALRHWAAAYRRDLWAAQPLHVEVWCESDSIAGVIDDVTVPLGVGLYVCRGQSSKTQVYEAVQSYPALEKPVVILYVGDWDPTGLAIPFSVEDRIARYGAELDLDVSLTRVAVTPEDVRSGGLVSHGVNTNDSNYRRFAERCQLMGLGPHEAVEVEAIPPGELRRRLRRALDDLTQDVSAWNATLAAEESEREIFEALLHGDTSAWSVPS